MLFYIATDIITLAQAGDNEAIKVLNRLGHSRYNDLNIVLSERESLDTLRKMEGLDLSARRAYHEAYIKSTSLFALLDIIGIQIFVVNEKKETINLEHKTIIKIPYTDLNKGSLFNGTSLLFENISEKKLYDHIVDWYRINNGLTSIKYSYQPLHGGGNCISDVLFDIQERSDSFCLAILDSDRKYPNCNYGDTAKQLIKVFKQTGMCDFLIVNTRECENLAPLSILEEVCPVNSDWEKGINDLKRINKIMPNSVLFIDYKKGLKEKNIYDSSSPLFINFYKKILLDSCFLLEEEYEMIRMKDEESFRTNNKIIIHSVGHEVLDRIIENLDDKSKNKVVISDFNPEDLIHEWTRIGKQILDWTCTLPHFA